MLLASLRRRATAGGGRASPARRIARTDGGMSRRGAYRFTLVVKRFYSPPGLDEDYRPTRAHVLEGCPMVSARPTYRTILIVLVFLSLAPLALPASTARASAAFDFRAHGLPEPRADTVTLEGKLIRGYDELLSRTLSRPDATWAVDTLLAAERLVSQKVTIKRYLTTAWVWFENGSSYWPDPFEQNCSGAHDVSYFCTRSGWQVAGYQMGAQRSKILLNFRLFWPESETSRIARSVVDGSYRASRIRWRYRDPGQQKGLVSEFLPGLDAVTAGDISPNSSIYTSRGQFFTNIVGKHPQMVIALNRYAVSDGDLVYRLKTQSCTYGYICAPYKQLIANMVAALIIRETGSLST